jgi:HEAT repeat protein
MNSFPSMLVRSLPVVTCLLLAGHSFGQTDFLGKPLSRWLVELRDAQPQVRRGAAFALGKSGSAAAPAALVKVLSDREAAVRDAAAYALGELAGEGHGGTVWSEAGPALVRLLADDDSPQVRRSAALALGHCGARASGARSALVKLLPDREPMVRQNAAWALGRLGGDSAEEAVAGLSRLLEDGDAAVRRDAAAALGEIGRPAASRAASALAGCLRREREGPVRKVVLDSLVKVVGAENKDVVAQLTPLVKDANREMARGVALALGKIGGADAKAAVPVLAEALHDDDATVRELAAGALGNVGEAAAGAVPDLSQALTDRSVAVRRNAALALSRIGDQAAPAVQALVRALAPTESPEVRYFAAEALGHVGAAVERVFDELLRVYKEDSDFRVRQRMVYALVHAEKADMRRKTAAAFEAMLDAKEPRLSLVRYDSARGLALLLGSEAPPRVIDVLVAMMKDPEIYHYQGSAATLQTGDERRAGGTGVQEKRGGDARFMAAVALEWIGPKANRPDVIAALEDAAGSKDETTQKAALKALATIRDRPN